MGNRLGSHSKDYETRLTNKTDGEGHGARKVDKGYGLRLQPGQTETGEACNGCMRTFRTISGACIPSKTDEDKEECPMQSNSQAEDNHLSKDDTPSTGSPGKVERNSQKDETKLPEEKENNTDVKLGKEEREEEE